MQTARYRGRIAPSPTGFLHLGHARTFWFAQERARAAGGMLLLRSDDLDRSRVRAEFIPAMIEDLRWFGFQWQEGPFHQSERLELYRGVLANLQRAGAVYPCTCSRQEVLRALEAPHAGDEEPVYPGTCRSRPIDDVPPRARVNWRFRVPAGEPVTFCDGACGPQSFQAGIAFGDFVIWRHDDLPSYQLACVADDDAMNITEIVRGADLLLSTARQILLYRALRLPLPRFYHCPLVLDENGVRLAKRHDALSLRALRERGITPEEIRRGWAV